MTEFHLNLEAEKEQLDACIIYQNKQLLFSYEKAKGMLEAPARINSCTKNVVSSLICIALQQGKLSSVDIPLYRFFKSLAVDKDSRKQQITLRHALTLSAGFRWQEFGGINSFPIMTRSEHWVNYVLMQPMSDKPGTMMNYNSGVSQLLSSVIVQLTGQSVASYAEETLFHTLNIQNYYWQQDPQGLHSGGFGLSLSPLDMLKLGMLYLDKGMYNHTRLIDETVIEEATAPSIAAASPGISGYYGWHWWVDPMKFAQDATVSYFYARGYGGQFIFVIPDIKAVVVTTRNQKIKAELPIAWFRNRLLPLLYLRATS